MERSLILESLPRESIKQVSVAFQSLGERMLYSLRVHLWSLILFPRKPRVKTRNAFESLKAG